MKTKRKVKQGKEGARHPPVPKTDVGAVALDNADRTIHPTSFDQSFDDEFLRSAARSRASTRQKPRRSSSAGSLRGGGGIWWKCKTIDY